MRRCPRRKTSPVVNDFLREKGAKKKEEIAGESPCWKYFRRGKYREQHPPPSSRVPLISQDVLQHLINYFFYVYSNKKKKKKERKRGTNTHLCPSNISSCSGRFCFHIYNERFICTHLCVYCQRWKRIFISLPWADGTQRKAVQWKMLYTRVFFFFFFPPIIEFGSW